MSLPNEIWDNVCRALTDFASYRAFALTCHDFRAITTSPVVLQAAIRAFSKTAINDITIRNIKSKAYFTVLPNGWRHGYYSVVSNNNGVMIEDGLMHCDSSLVSWLYGEAAKIAMEYIVDTSTMIHNLAVYHRTIIPKVSSKLFWFRHYLNPPVFLSAYMSSTHVMVFRENVLIYRVDLNFRAGCLEKDGNEYIWDDDGLLFHAVWVSGRCLSHSCPRNPALTPFSYVFYKRMSCDDLLLE